GLERASSDLCFTRKPLALLRFSPAESGLALKRSTRCTFCLTYSYLWVSVRGVPWGGGVYRYLKKEKHMPDEVIELSGHIIDSWTLPRAWDVIMDRGGNFAVEEMRVGTSKTEPSYARLKVEAPDDETLELILSELQQFGAVLLHGNDVQTLPVEQNGVLPAKFYSTTNLPTQVRLNGQWVNVEGIEMDVAIVIDRSSDRAYCRPMHEVQVGDQVV